MIIDGNIIAAGIKNNLKKQIKRLKTRPVLGIILVGRDKPSQIFVAQKVRFCKEVGISVELVSINEDVKSLAKKVKEAVLKLNKSQLVSGIIIQLPLPKTLKKFQDEIFQLINPEKDIDCLTPTNLGQLNSRKDAMQPAVVRACLETLARYEIGLKSKTVLVLGWGQVVGKPLTPALLHQGATVIVCHEFTKNLNLLTKKADIIISAVGKPAVLNGKMVKSGVIALDVGSSFRSSKIVGDFEMTSMQKKAGLITPVPGGIGPVTVAMVAQNVFECHLRQG